MKIKIVIITCLLSVKLFSSQSEQDLVALQKLKTQKQQDYEAAYEDARDRCHDAGPSALAFGVTTLGCLYAGNHCSTACACLPFTAATVGTLFCAGYLGETTKHCIQSRMEYKKAERAEKALKKME